MRKLVLVFIVVLLFTTPAMAGFESCDVAGQYGWHSGYHNMLCFFDIMNDIFDVELVIGDLDDVVGGEIEGNTQVQKKGSKVVKGKQ